MTILLIDGNNRFHHEINRITPSHPVREAYNLYSVLPARYSLVWLVWDGRGSVANRKEIYPNYKGNREEHGADFYAMMNMFKEVIECTNVLQVEVSGYEADDVIGTLAKYMKEDVTIHSNDSDFYQLENVLLPFINFNACVPEYVTTYKATVGDTADNIPGIRGFGPKSWLKQSSHWANMKLALEIKDFSLWGDLTDEGTFQQCVRFFQVVTLQQVPHNLIVSSIKPGLADDAKAQEFMGRYMI